MTSDVSIRFLGAAGTVTGAKFLLQAGEERLLVDCGMFQGLKELRLRNWAPLPVDPASIDHVVLTHGHIDHSGYTPRLAREGYRGKFWATHGTCDLLRVLLPDAAHLQEEEAEYRNRKGTTKHKPALPLFDKRDAERVLSRMAPVGYEEPFALGERFRVSFRMAGHILGSAVVLVEISRGEAPPLRVAFSGDLGRYDAPILHDPKPLPEADYLVVESTYGGRRHPSQDEAIAQLADVVNETMDKRGVLLVPAFAIGRTQNLLYELRSLEDEGRIPRLPIYVDSPMAIRASTYYARHEEEFDAETRRLTEQRAQPLRPDGLKFCERVSQSKRLNSIDSGAIIISASGMMTGGRILHHAAVRLPNPRHTILFTGFQAAGTRGRRLLEGEPEIRIHGQTIPVRARVAHVEGFSAHGDEDEILRWAGGFTKPPRRTFVVHGEPKGSAALAARLEADLAFPTHVPVYDESVVLD